MTIDTENKNFQPLIDRLFLNNEKWAKTLIYCQDILMQPLLDMKNGTKSVISDKGLERLSQIEFINNHHPFSFIYHLVYLFEKHKEESGQRLKPSDALMLESHYLNLHIYYVTQGYELSRHPKPVLSLQEKLVVQDFIKWVFDNGFQQKDIKNLVFSIGLLSDIAKHIGALAHEVNARFSENDTFYTKNHIKEELAIFCDVCHRVSLTIDSDIVLSLPYTRIDFVQKHIYATCNVFMYKDNGKFISKYRTTFLLDNQFKNLLAVDNEFIKELKTSHYIFVDEKLSENQHLKGIGNVDTLTRLTSKSLQPSNYKAYLTVSISDIDCVPKKHFKIKAKRDNDNFVINQLDIDSIGVAVRSIRKHQKILSAITPDFCARLLNKEDDEFDDLVLRNNNDKEPLSNSVSIENIKSINLPKTIPVSFQIQKEQSGKTVSFVKKDTLYIEPFSSLINNNIDDIMPICISNERVIVKPTHELVKIRYCDIDEKEVEIMYPYKLGIDIKKLPQKWHIFITDDIDNDFDIEIEF